MIAKDASLELVENCAIEEFKESTISIIKASQGKRFLIFMGVAGNSMAFSRFSSVIPAVNVTFCARTLKAVALSSSLAKIEQE